MRRGWWGIELPGYREAGATYERLDVSLPPIERELDEQLAWLRAQPAVPESLAVAPASPDPIRPADGSGLAALVEGWALQLPPEFSAFVGDPEPRRRVRSCTACYLDLADVVVPAPGGALVHFLSDQQWVLHWLLYVGDDGNDAVLSTDLPYGFTSGGAPSAFDAAPENDEGTIVCAESFSEFLYRFWIENEIWFALADVDEGEKPRPLTAEQRRYVEFYADAAG